MLKALNPQAPEKQKQKEIGKKGKSKAKQGSQNGSGKAPSAAQSLAANSNGKGFSNGPTAEKKEEKPVASGAVTPSNKSGATTVSSGIKLDKVGPVSVSCFRRRSEKKVKLAEKSMFCTSVMMLNEFRTGLVILYETFLPAFSSNH